MELSTPEMFKVYSISITIGMLFIFGLIMCCLWATQSKKEKKINAKIFIGCAIVEIVGVLMTVWLLQSVYAGY